MINDLFDTFSYHCRIGGATLYLAKVAQLFFSEHTLFTVFELISYRHRAEGGSMTVLVVFVVFVFLLTFVLFRIRPKQLHAGHQAGDVIQGSHGLWARDCTVLTFHFGRHGGEGQRGTL